jgi:hypothetical protein
MILRDVEGHPTTNMIHAIEAVEARGMTIGVMETVILEAGVFPMEVEENDLVEEIDGPEEIHVVVVVDSKEEGDMVIERLHIRCLRGNWCVMLLL